VWPERQSGLLVEGRALNGGLEGAPLAGDVEGLARLGVRRLVGDVAESDPCVEYRRLRAAGDDADRVAVRGLDRVVVAGNPSLGGDKAHEFPFGAACLDVGEGVAPDELALVELYEPAEAGLVRIRFLGNVVAMEAQPCFEAEGVKPWSSPCSRSVVHTCSASSAAT